MWTKSTVQDSIRYAVYMIVGLILHFHTVLFLVYLICSWSSRGVNRVKLEFRFTVLLNLGHYALNNRKYKPLFAWWTDSEVYRMFLSIHVCDMKPYTRRENTASAEWQILLLWFSLTSLGLHIGTAECSPHTRPSIDERNNENISRASIQRVGDILRELTGLFNTTGCNSICKA